MYTQPPITPRGAAKSIGHPSLTNGRGRKISWRLILFLAGFGVLVYFIARLGPDQIAEQLLSIGPSFVFMPAVFGAGQALRAFGLSVLVRRNLRPKRSALIASRFAATSLNDLLPFFGVGGEASRLLWFPAQQRSDIIPALILDRVLLIVADAIYVITVLSLALIYLALPAEIERNATIFIGATIIIITALTWIIITHGLATPIVRFLRWLRIIRTIRRLQQAQEIDRAIQTTWKKYPQRMLANLAIQLGSRAFLVAETWLGLVILKVPAGPLAVLIISSIPMIISVLLSFIPSQIGAQEAATVLVFSALHLTPSTGIVLSVLQRIRQLIFIPLGFFLLSRAPRPKDPESN